MRRTMSRPTKVSCEGCKEKLRLEFTKGRLCPKCRLKRDGIEVSIEKMPLNRMLH